MEENIKRVILKYRELIPQKIIDRELMLFDTQLDKSNIVIGPRRAGKSFFMYSLMKKEKNPVMINFEDNLLIGLNKNNLNKILDYSKELFGSENLVFFFDEIQNVDGWDRFIVSLLNEHYKIYITGSNSKLLSKEIATSLRGKSISYLLLPFSFKEYLKCKGIEIKKNFEYTNIAFEIKKNFNDYLKFGGFPEVILSSPEQLKDKLINNYFDSVLYKDLVERLNLKNISLVEITIKYFINLFGSNFSISAYENYLKSNKIPYSLEDLYRIIRSLEDVFMVGYVKDYSKSFKKSEMSSSKVYLFDTAYIQFLSNSPEDYGRILENLVFIELFRRQGEVENKHIFYSKSEKGRECDFVISERDKIKEAIQVCYNLTEDNKDREIGGLIEALERFNLKEGLILTYDREEEIKISGRKIIARPVWKWLLQGKSQKI
jgi:predicted AAA+ superfamily ATPase